MATAIHATGNGGGVPMAVMYTSGWRYARVFDFVNDTATYISGNAPASDFAEVNTYTGEHADKVTILQSGVYSIIFQEIEAVSKKTLPSGTVIYAKDYGTKYEGGTTVIKWL